MRNVHPAGLVGRAIAAVGAGLWIVSLFLELDESGFKRWEGYRREDIVTLVAAIAVIVLLFASIFVLENLFLFVVAVVGGFVLNDAVFNLIEFSDRIDFAIGTWVSVIASALLIGGGAVAVLASREEELAFMPAAAPTSPPAAAPTSPPDAAPSRPAEAAGPAPGWYSDPSGQARLRYWDGQTWTEQTQE